MYVSQQTAAKTTWSVNPPRLRNETFHKVAALRRRRLDVTPFPAHHSPLRRCRWERVKGWGGTEEGANDRLILLQVTVQFGFRHICFLMWVLRTAAPLKAGP